CRDAEQVGVLGCGWAPVDVAIARGRAGDVDARLVQVGDPLEALVQQMVDVRELAGDALLRVLKNKALCLIYEVDRLAISLPTDARDLLAGFDQPPESRELANDSCVVGHVRGGRDEVRKREEADLGSNRFTFALLVVV